jgi:hypothetical protein
MIYISIPQGMKYQKLMHEGRLKDCFVDEHGTKVIPFQDHVKETLRHNKKQRKEISLAEIKIYLYPPKLESGRFLKYEPENNGKFPTTKTPEVTELITNPSHRAITQSGQCWFQVTPISTQRREEIEAKRDEQLHNRRHDGDSPLPT